MSEQLEQLDKFNTITEILENDILIRQIMKLKYYIYNNDPRNNEKFCEFLRDIKNVSYKTEDFGYDDTIKIIEFTHDEIQYKITNLDFSSTYKYYIKKESWQEIDIDNDIIHFIIRDMKRYAI